MIRDMILIDNGYSGGVKDNVKYPVSCQIVLIGDTNMGHVRPN